MLPPPKFWIIWVIVVVILNMSTLQDVLVHSSSIVIRARLVYRNVIVMESSLYRVRNVIELQLHYRVWLKHVIKPCNVMSITFKCLVEHVM